MRPKGICAVVDWDSVGWAERIVRKMGKSLANSHTEILHLPRVDGATLTGCPLPTVQGEPGEGFPLVYTVLVVAAGGGGITEVGGLFSEELASGRADLVVVDCRIDRLDGVCRAVQCLPRWPIAWLPASALGDREKSLECLAQKLVARIWSSPAGKELSNDEAGVWDQTARSTLPDFKHVVQT